MPLLLLTQNLRALTVPGFMIHSAEDISSRSSASSDDSVSDAISESVYEVEQPTNSTAASGCGRVLSGGRGRGLSRGRR